MNNAAFAGEILTFLGWIIGLIILGNVVGALFEIRRILRVMLKIIRANVANLPPGTEGPKA